MKKSFLIICILPILAFTQEIKGRIQDAFDNPIKNAHIINKSNRSTAITDEQGLFSLSNTFIGDTVTISHINYFNTEKVITGSVIKSGLDITLKKKIVNLKEISIVNNIKALNVFTEIDLQANPVNSSQEILRTVPGLFIGQHAGGGKAEQIFLRAFDIDHGTDITITADGIPVNMVSHAHGQGYADLHFLIPETIEKIDYGKGPYYLNKGNFNTAGYVDYKTKEKLDHSFISTEIGSFNTFRNVVLLNLLKQSKHNAYLASEYLISDGPFESPQNFVRFNLMGKYTGELKNNAKLSFLFSTFNSEWTASGQIPERAVKSGLISRFGAIDDTEGGNTSRSNILVQYSKMLDQKTWLTNKSWYSTYDFDLYSNFTFFLNNPENGDQIRQKENRKLYGSTTEIRIINKTNKTEIITHGGIGFRHDDVNDVKLSHTKNRVEVLENVKYGDIQESNIFAFLGKDLNMGKWKIFPSIRVDYFRFHYQDKLEESNSSSLTVNPYKVKSQAQFHPTIPDINIVMDDNSSPTNQERWTISPKLNILYNANPDLQFFLKTGKGFHSNDSRVILEEQTDKILPEAYSADLGTIWKAFDRLILNTSLWYIFLEQELIYVGDEGIIEPSGKTRRLGIDYSMRYQINSWMYIMGDINYAWARYIDEPEGENHIPLAPNLTTAGGLFFKHKTGLSGGIRYRYLNDRPANEDNSIVAKGYFIMDCNIQYDKEKWSLGVDIQNLFDNDWNETQFNTESRLYDELSSVEEIHFTPGTPFFLKVKLVYKF